jgi:Fe-S-cluster-containing hydrogenase components 1
MGHGQREGRKVGKSGWAEGHIAKIASTVFASLVAPAVLSDTAQATTEKQTTQTPSLPELPPPKPNEDPLIRMMRDLQRALKKPLEKRRWVMVIDLRKCVGCKACTVACIVENKLPPSVVYRPVLEEEIGKYPRVTRRFIPRPCHAM